LGAAFRRVGCGHPRTWLWISIDGGGAIPVLLLGLPDVGSGSSLFFVLLISTLVFPSLLFHLLLWFVVVALRRHSGYTGAHPGSHRRAARHCAGGGGSSHAAARWWPHEGGMWACEQRRWQWCCAGRPPPSSFSSSLLPFLLGSCSLIPPLVLLPWPSSFFKGATAATRGRPRWRRL
jgi:hypothetical protein